MWRVPCAALVFGRATDGPLERHSRSHRVGATDVEPHQRYAAAGREAGSPLAGINYAEKGRRNDVRPEFAGRGGATAAVAISGSRGWRKAVRVQAMLPLPHPRWATRAYEDRPSAPHRALPHPDGFR